MDVSPDPAKWTSLYVQAVAMCVLSVGGCGHDASVPSSAREIWLAAEPAEVEIVANESEPRQKMATVKLVNRGKQKVEITSVVTPCSCTMAEPLAKTVLLPGEYVSLGLKLSVPSHGRRQTVVMVKSSPLQEEPASIRVKLRGPDRHLPYVISSPSRLRLAGYRPGEKVTAVFQIVAEEEPGSQHWIQDAIAATEAITVRRNDNVLEEVRPGSVVRTYMFTVVGDLPQTGGKSEKHYLDISTTMAEEQPGVRRIPAILELMSPVRAAPEVVRYRRAGPRASADVRRVTIISNMPGKISVNEIVEIPDWLTVRRISPDSEARAHVFELALDQAKQPGPGARRAEVRFRVSHEAIGDWFVPVSVGEVI